MHSILRPLILLAGLAAVAAPAHAWGPTGHRLVARLAEQRLSAQARAEVQRLLAGEADPTLAGIANWADGLRSTDPELGKRSARWHYVNLGESGCQYQAQLHCPDGDCVVAALQAQSAILADTSRSLDERRQALKFVVHFVGDVHQPLHAGHAHDLGGNRHQVRLGDSGTNLHAAWDSGLLNAPRAGADGKPRRWNEEAWLAYLNERVPVEPGSLQLEGAGPALPWAEQSCRIVLEEGFYPPKGATIDARYIQAQVPRMEVQLKLAGLRLASLLDSLLAPASPPTR